jgi:cold-inducible RNA-binding protein
MKTQIYAGNLAYKMSENQLKDIFEEIGPVESVKIITDRESGRSKGFGFIKMSNSSDAEKAIAQLDGAVFMDRNLKINAA